MNGKNQNFLSLWLINQQKELSKHYQEISPLVFHKYANSGKRFAYLQVFNIKKSKFLA